MAAMATSKRLILISLALFPIVSGSSPHIKRQNASTTFDSLLLPGVSLLQLEAGQSVSSVVSNDFTCGPERPCVNGACCGPDGWCGYEPKYCGEGCQSNCEAKAECGAYSDPPNQNCPLNVCCSKFGFCGTTAEFCAAGCQSNCEQPKPKTATTNVQQKIIAYWEGWNSNNACENMSPDEIPIYDISHLIFSFGFITPDDFRITNMPDVRPELFERVTYLKNKNPDLVIQIALGGWTHNDPGKWQDVFSDMVSTRANRAKFIKNLLGFMSEFGFDGVDFDWEYPGVEDRGGRKEDGVNYTLMLQELQQAIRAVGKQYVVTYTAPTSYWYLRHFDLANMNQYVDWINLMSYDLHGTWDAENPIGNKVLGHTNLTEIDLALDLFWRNDIPPKDIVLGIGFYGRSFKLKDPKCWKPGCPFSGGGDKGECTNTSGFLSYSEIMNIVGSTNAKPMYDKEAKVNYLVYGQNNWISYDDKRTFQDKIDFANERGLNGLMIWAIDLDDRKHSALSALTRSEITPGTGFDAIPMLGGTDMILHTSDDPSQCRVTECGLPCSPGEVAVGRVGRGQCGSDSNNAKFICCPAWTSLTSGSCHWDAGGGAVKSDCSGKCNVGEIKLLGDSDGWEGDILDGKYGNHCLRGGKIFCCDAGNMKRYLEICSWTKCGEKCPNDKQNVLTWDSGGPIDGGPRCDNHQPDGDPFEDNPEEDLTTEGDPEDPTKGTEGKRKLCCPKPDSFKNCSWKKGKYCSEQCGKGQFTLDLDPQGQGGKYCHNGRQQVFCCDARGKKDQPFLPVDLDKLFPPEYLPPADAIPTFELQTFGQMGPMSTENPNDSGVAFMLLASSDVALSSMSKRNNPGLHFLDCPAGITESSLQKRHVARVICLDNQPEECFAVAKGGVEGTVVHLPHACGKGTFARAVSLTPSLDQSVPVEISLKNPTSAVYDFTFDYDMKLVRRDAGSYSIRMDYSNVAGYWDAVVDSAGVNKRSLKDLVARFYSNTKEGWFDKFDSIEITNRSKSPVLESPFKHLVLLEDQMCTMDEGQTKQGIVAAIEGTLDIQFFYGFSLIATWTPDSTEGVVIRDAAGFLHPIGKTFTTFTVAGIGKLDTSQKFNGKSLRRSLGKSGLTGHSLFQGWASFVTFKEEMVKLDTRSDDSSQVTFNGYLEVKSEVDWNTDPIHFPSEPDGGSMSRIKMERRSKITPTGHETSESIISLANIVTLGLQISLAFDPYEEQKDLPRMTVDQTTTAMFHLEESSGQVCLATAVSADKTAGLQFGASVGWDSTYTRQAFKKVELGSTECFSGESFNKARSDVSLGPNTPSDSKLKKKKRQNNSHITGDYSRDSFAKALINHYSAKITNDGRGDDWGPPEINCDECLGTCTVTGLKAPCCNCGWLPPEDDDDLFGNSWTPIDIKRDLLNQPSQNIDGNELESRATSDPGRGYKDILFWPTTSVKFSTEYYPAFPDYHGNPGSQVKWDTASNTRGVKKYFHNATGACDSFDVAQFTTHDWVYPYPKYMGDPAKTQYQRGKAYHASYNTEHVFEAQTISRFFVNWMPAVTNGMAGQFWVETWVLSDHPRWGISKPFIHHMVDELGSRLHRDRLTVFMARPNQAKGKLFSGNAPITPSTFAGYERGAEQLLAAREIGYIFTYMNLDTVWESFCDTYNGMYDRLEEFDNWYAQTTNTVSGLADEWPKFVRAELDHAVRSARIALHMMNKNKKEPGLPMRLHWSTIMSAVGGEILKVKLDRVDKCRNFPATGVPAYTPPPP